MESIVPPSLLFDFRLSIPRCPKPASRKTGRLLKLPQSAQLFVPSTMNEQPAFAKVRAAWNEDGLAVEINVHGKSTPLTGSSEDVTRSDCTLLWIDTRPTGNIHRATEYCHHFACLPSDEHSNGIPMAVVQPIAQQRSQRVESDARKIKCRTHTRKQGYDFEIWIPGNQLNGFRETSELGRIGFYFVVRDMELGEQALSVHDDFPISYDPSMWIQLDLVS